MDIIESTRRYDRWLKERLKGDIFHEDVENKHEKMAATPFSSCARPTGAGRK